MGSVAYSGATTAVSCSVFPTVTRLSPVMAISVTGAASTIMVMVAEAPDSSIAWAVITYTPGSAAKNTPLSSTWPPVVSYITVRTSAFSGSIAAVICTSSITLMVVLGAERVMLCTGIVSGSVGSVGILSGTEGSVGCVTGTEGSVGCVAGTEGSVGTSGSTGDVVASGLVGWVCGSVAGPQPDSKRAHTSKTHKNLRLAFMCVSSLCKFTFIIQQPSIFCN